MMNKWTDKERKLFQEMFIGCNARGERELRQQGLIREQGKEVNMASEVEEPDDGDLLRAPISVNEHRDLERELTVLRQLVESVGKYLDPGKLSGTCPDEYMNEDFLDDAYDKWRELKEEDDDE